MCFEGVCCAEASGSGFSLSMRAGLAAHGLPPIDRLPFRLCSFFSRWAGMAAASDGLATADST